jgi:hypothetical protein
MRFWWKPKVGPTSRRLGTSGIEQPTYFSAMYLFRFPHFILFSILRLLYAVPSKVYNRSFTASLTSTVGFLGLSWFHRRPISHPLQSPCRALPLLCITPRDVTPYPVEALVRFLDSKTKSEQQICNFWEVFFTGATTLCGSWPPPQFRNSKFSEVGSLAPRPTPNLEGYNSSGPYPLTYLAWVTTPGAYAPASIALRVANLLSTIIIEKYWREKKKELEINFLENKLEFKICNKMRRCKITIVRPCRHNGYSDDTEKGVITIVRPSRRRRSPCTGKHQ